jgi:hypothetical protein
MKAITPRRGGRRSREVDAIIERVGGWRGETLSRLRSIVMQADSEMIEEVKWKKPSNPAGVPVWSQAGIVCIGEALKNAVRLTFPKGALLADPDKLFNTRLESKSVRAIDFGEGEAPHQAGLSSLVVRAVRLNQSKATTR